jgi:hypothetical protein
LRLSEKEYEDLIARGRAGAPVHVATNKGSLTVQKPKPHERGTRHGKKPGPNKSEAEYGRMLALEFPGCRVTFEGITLKMDNGHRYTPDWVVQTHGGWMLLVECKSRGKNGYRLPSYQRAKLAYDQCKEEFNCFRYRWSEKQEGKWVVGQ